jgi:hypothetical protein
VHIPERDRTILQLKAKEMSNRWIAGRLDLSETAVRKSLRRHGWKPLIQPCFPGLGDVSPEAEPATVSDNPSIKTRPPAAEPPSLGMEQPKSNSVANSLDADPLDRYQKMLNFLRTTTTKTGLAVSAYLNRAHYPTDLDADPVLSCSLRLRPHKTLPAWNYTITPNL